jgi:hypothetical protein
VPRAGRFPPATREIPRSDRPMGMKQTLDVINRMEADGIIGRYAIAGAVAAYNYIEPS